jgi:outer membrane receptor protein involved in Fe transport
VTNGSSRRATNRRASVATILALLIAGPVTAAQRQTFGFSIPATTLDLALTRIGRLAGIDVVSTEAGLAQVRSRPITGRLTPRAALETLLKGTGYRLVQVDARSFRVVRGAPPVAAIPHRVALPPARQPERSDRPAGEAQEIIVTASKQRVPLLRYPGSLTVIGFGPTSPAGATGDLTTTARVTPVLQNTEFGPGRDKIFIRGIADSSFNGAAQSTASIYLGDVQLSYSGTDPGIRLYDMQDVEVLEGPQGTLYGSGSIGGIVRLDPAPPALDRVSGSVVAGATLTRGGDAGGDLAAILNLPVIEDAAGLRAVAYRTRDGGYIDDVGSGRTATNRVDTVGGRLAGRLQPGNGWRVDLTGLYQRIDAADAQYADPSVGRLARRAAIPQPYDNAILLGSTVVAKQWDSGLQLLSVTGVARSHAHNRFDATPPERPGAPTPSPIVYTTSQAKVLLTQETRLSRPLANGAGWVVGFTLLRNTDAENRTLGAVAAPADIIGVTNVTTSGSLFAEGTARVLPSFSVTLGARLTIARIDGEPSFRPRASDYVEGRSTRRVDPTIAFSWALAPRLTAFGRGQTGYRTGGLAVARGIGRVADFRSDSIRVGEVGLRRLREGETGLSVTTALSFARWTAIQADLVNRRGLPYTANIGNARVEAIEGTVDWVPRRGLRGIVGFLQTHNTTSGAMSAETSPAHRRLPDTPPFAITGDLSYRWQVGAGDTLLVGASAQHVGRSVLGTGDLFDIDQGRFSTLGLRAGWSRGRYDLSLAAENVTDSRGNLFSSGNPFDLTTRSLITPLRPFNVRLGVRMGW